jgi:hypothetical protein
MGTLESSEQLQGGAHVGLRLCLDPGLKRDELVRSDTGGASPSQLLPCDNPCATLVSTMEAAMIDWTQSYWVFSFAWSCCRSDFGDTEISRRSIAPPIPRLAKGSSKSNND